MSRPSRKTTPPPPVNSESLIVDGGTTPSPEEGAASVEAPAPLIAETPPVPDAPPPPGDEDDDDQDEDGRPDPDELLTPGVKQRIRALLAEQLRLAERDERSGPGGMGWEFNETKRQDVEEWAAFLRFVATQLPPE